MIGMIHLFLAACFCTIGLMLMAFEAYKNSFPISKGFAWFYSLGMVGWMIVGIMQSSSALVTISIIQFFSIVLTYFMGRVNERA